jgi:hypothetical protein
MKLHRLSAAFFFIAVLCVSPVTHGQDKLNSSLKLLRTIRHNAGSFARSTGPARVATVSNDVLVTVKFDHVLAAAEVADYERAGLQFFRIGGEIARTASIYPARARWAEIEKLSARPELVRMESVWKPCLQLPMDLAGPEVEAPDVWDYSDPLGLPLTGRGKRIADFDTGADIFHPAFFFADGDTLDWLDVNINGVYNAGVDAVDINGNGVADAGETLRFNDGWISDYAGVWSADHPSNDDNVYQTYWDWLYADTNNNGERDFGPGAGFTESDPTYGEPLYITLDDNDNGALDPGEKLVALGTSKIVATLNDNLVERLRGVDLIHSDIDQYGHGTPVAGAIAGGVPGRHRFNGVAPDAELIIGNFGVPNGANIAYMIPWARSHGADVMLHEWSMFLYEFLDGSSLDEQIISAEYDTILQVTPVGNLNGGGKHARVQLTAGGSGAFYFTVPSTPYTDVSFYFTARWLPPGWTDLSFRLVTPGGTGVDLVDSVYTTDGYDIWNNREVSPRGTHKLDLIVDAGSNANVHGAWRLEVSNDSLWAFEVIANVADNNSSWSGNTVFTAGVYNSRNFASPSTADNTLANGSYSTRGFEYYLGPGGGSVPAGEISTFSARGKRIDDRPIVDLASPGNYDVFSTRSHQDVLGYPLGSYQQFSGTSAAAPLVAGGAAILMQAFPGARPFQIEKAMRRGAIKDAFTGPNFNLVWGHGKLRILNSMDVASAVTDMADGNTPPVLLLGQNYPNPFNPSTWIPFFLPEDGVATLTVYNVRGQLVRVLRNKWYHKGAHSVFWDGRDWRGGDAASGVYFCTLRQGQVEQTRKLVLVR